MIDKVLIGGMLFGFIAGFWEKIKFFLNRFISLFYVTVTVEGKGGLSIRSYCWDNFKRSPFGNLWFDSNIEFVRPIKRFQLISYEILGKEPVVFWMPFKILGIPLRAPLTLTKVESKDDYDRHSNSICMSYVRGTIKIDDLICKSVESYNNIFTSLDVYGDNVKKFHIHRIVGKGRRVSQEQDGGLHDPEHEESVSYSVQLGDKRLLSWNKDDIGPDLIQEISMVDSLSLTDEALKMIKEIEQWLKSEEWFREKLIPWKRGWLLYGPAGTGKTSLVRAIAQDLDLPIWSYDLSTLTNEELIKNWDRMLARVPCIALFEDIDNVFDGRVNTGDESGGGLTFDCFLNCLDGVKKSDGVFIVITTNRVEKLDKALGLPVENQDEITTRPGRIDRSLKMDVLTKEGREKIANRVLISYIKE